MERNIKTNYITFNVSRIPTPWWLPGDASTMECKVMSYDEETELLYTQVEGVSTDESILNAKGKVDIKKLCPLCYDPEGHGYYALGEKIGNAFKDGKSIK